jgi:hypothetical protein
MKLQRTTDKTTFIHFNLLGFMNYFSYVHKTFGAVSMRVNTWEIPSLLMVIADLNKNGEVISHVTTKSV